MANKFLIRLLIGLSGLILIILIFAPLIVRKVVVNQSKEWIGRSISLEKLKVNYFTGTVKLIDFHLYEEDDTTIFLGFDTLIIDTEPYRYINNNIVIEQLYLKGLETHVVLYDSIFNFNDLLESQQSEVSDTDTSAVADPIKFVLSNFELNDAMFTLRDAAIDKQMELSNIDFFVPYLSWDQEHTSEAGLRFDFKNGGYFQSNIDLHPTKGDFEAEIMLQGFDISGYTDFTKKYVDVGAFEGQTDFDVKLTGNINDPGAMIISGLFRLYDFNLNDQVQQPLFSVDQLNVKLHEVDMANNSFIIDSVTMFRPRIYFEMRDSTNNILDYIEHINITGSEKDTTQIKLDSVRDNTTKAIYYALNHLNIDAGIVDIVDHRTSEPFKYHLSKLQLKVDSITSISNWIAMQSDMVLNERGKLVASVGLNPKTPMDQLTVDYTITDFMLSDLNIYSNHYMGFPILYGDMYYKAHTEIINGIISSENQLIIHNVELGQKGRGIYDLPLKFALFLLKDKDGVITLDVPVSGDLKDPKVSVGKIVWNTFKNLIVKAAAAPVKLLSGLIGADPAEIESIEYDYLDTAFTEKKQHQLDLLLQLEKEKPALEIELIYLNDIQLEKQQIALTEIGRMYENDNPGKSYKGDQTNFEEFVYEKVENDTLMLSQACMQIADPALIDSIFNELEKKRLLDISDYLNVKNDSTEILVIPFKDNSPKKPEQQTHF
jgi:hypothetical protein